MGSPQSRHEQFRTKLAKKAPSPSELEELRNIRNRVRRGKLPRFTSRKLSVKPTRRKVEYVA